ncbi:hypothetical protein MHYP_G00086910 [Metynnis hypsauchen]
MEDADKQWQTRLVLLGNVGAGKSASGNTLLGVNSFVSKISPSSVTKQCVAQTVTLAGRRIMVVDTPGLTATMVTDTAKENLLHCLQLSAPGPHVFLLVIPLGRFTQEERDTVERAADVFGKKLYMFSIILFTFKDRLKNTSIEKFIISAGDNLQQLVQKCGGRYHAFNNENPGNEDQVGSLLVQIDKLVAANGGSWYTQVTDMEEFEGRLDQHLREKKDYEVTFKIHETKPGENKGERRRDTENMEFEENLRRREEWIWRQEEQLWKREERLRALENHLRASEEQIMKWKEQLYSSEKKKEELSKQIEAERRDRQKEKQEMDRIMKEMENRSHDLQREKERIEAEWKEIERQQIDIEAQKDEMRQSNLTKQVMEKEVEELEKRQSNADITKLQEEKMNLLKELQRMEQQMKRNSDEIDKQKKEMKITQEMITKLEKQKLCEQNVTVIRSEEEQNKYREMRSREIDLQILQDVYDQLDNRLYTSSYMQDCDTEGVLTEELGKIIEKMKTDLLRCSEEMEDDAVWGSTATAGQAIQKQKVSEKDLPPIVHHPDTQGSIIRKSTLQSLSKTLQCLSLDNFYPNKLTIESILSIGSPKEKQSDSNVAFSYLQKLLMLNYRVRFITDEYKNQNCTLSIRSGGNSNTEDDIDGIRVSVATEDGSNYGARYETVAKGIPQSVCDMEEISYEYDHLDEFFNEKIDSNNAKEKEKIHPMDVQMAVFHCADSFLRQYMVTKLSSCQYALPLLVPSPTSTDIEFQLWTFQQIKKTWKSVGGLSTSLPVSQIKAPMVFFCRLGSVSTSKSQLLNSVINPKHDTFFHRDSPGSSRNRLFMEGLVEIAWYCPAGNTDDLFSECIAFCNLHGDAVDHRKQTDFMSEQATVNIILMQNMKPNDKDRELLEKLHNSSKPFICVVSDLQKGPLKISHGLNIKVGLNGRNCSESHSDLTSAIKTCLQKCNISCKFSLEESSAFAKHFGFRVDEKSRYCQEGKTRAEEVIKLLEGENLSEIKNKFMPCQGKLWHEWTRKNKQLHRLHGEMEHTRNVTLAEMNKIRMKQRGSNLRFMKSFVKNLLSNSKTQTRYFFQWIRYFIDARFSAQVSQVHLKYNSKWLEVQKLKNTQGKSGELNVLQKQLEEVSEELDTVTFDLEHIFREMGQIYEAWAAVPEEMRAEVSIFPAAAADLLISGHPLELMDGDAAHVPLTWIQSVLDKVTESLGDQRVFVLSVLGLQSSGKSTMLNAMFGLQFAVSAGKCTRGAFMQLIRVKEEDKDQLKFDYLLVVDTEGLQSLQQVGKSTYNHDNELITFVTGLANMTLINIFGENPAEMEGILHVAIQAVLRMKKVRLNPSCMFVHQNITDITTAEKNMERRMHLQKRLDEMTSLVAREQDCDIKCFSELIKFNIQTDVHYFAQLWEGNPPMAPPNPRYSENIESLKQAILKAAAQQKALRFSELKVRIKDLWTAVLNEDFVFNFRNSLEITAYRKLEVMYGKWT